MYKYVLVHTSMYLYIQVCTGLYRFVQLLNLITRHRFVDMVNRFGSEDKHLLCVDGQVHTSTDQYILVRTGTYAYVPSCTDE